MWWSCFIGILTVNSHPDTRRIQPLSDSQVNLTGLQIDHIIDHNAFDNISFGSENFIRSMDSNYIKQYNVNTLPIAIEENPYLFVAFCTPWCANCQRTGHEFSKTAWKRHRQIAFGLVDISSDVQIWDGYGLSEYPSFMLFKQGVSSFMIGSHDYHSFSRWLDEQLEPLFLLFQDNREVLSYSKTTQDIKIAIFNGNVESFQFELFENLAREARDKGFLNKFGVIQNQSSSSPIVTYFGEAQFRIYDGHFEEEPLRVFMEREQFALWSELHVNNMQAYHESPSHSIVVICFPPSGIQESIQSWRPILNRLADQFRMHYVFTWIDTAEYSDLAIEHLGCQGLDPEDGRMTVVAQTSIHEHGPTFTKVFPNSKIDWQFAIDPWLRNVNAGTADRHIFSSRDLPYIGGHAKDVTAFSWQNVVVDSGKDSIIFIYASWCPHSKHFAPVYAQFARIMAEYNVTAQLSILKMDGERNTIDQEGLNWSRFPAIYYIQRGLGNPIFHDCADTKAKDLVSFVQHSASFVELSELVHKGADPIINISKISEVFNHWGTTSDQVSSSVYSFVEDYRKLVREQRQLFHENVKLKNILAACRADCGAFDQSES